MLSLNTCSLIGNLGKDAETRSLTSGGHTVTNFSVATTYSYKKNEKWENETTWHKCVLFNASDFVKSALVKGMPVYVEGRIQNRSYENKQGEMVYITEIVANKIIPLSKVEFTEREDEPVQDKPVGDPFGGTDEDLPF